MLYNLVMSITTVIQIWKQVDSFVSGTNSLLISWLWPIAIRGERHNSYYADPIPNVWHISWCLRSLLVEIYKTWPHASTVEDPTLNVRIPNSRLNGPIWTDSFSKSSNSQDHLFQAWCHPYSSPISCLGVYYDNSDCHTHIYQHKVNFYAEFNRFQFRVFLLLD